MITLVVFTLVNLSLVRIKRLEPEPQGVRVFPFWIPIVGFLVSAGFLLFVALT